MMLIIMLIINMVMMVMVLFNTTIIFMTGILRKIYKCENMKQK